MDSNDLTLDRWLQTVSDEEAIRALTHALAVVKVRAELRQQQQTQPVSVAAAVVTPVDATSLTPMRESTDHTLAQSLTSQLQPELPAPAQASADQSRVAVPVLEPSVEVATKEPSVVIASEDELAKAKTLRVTLSEVATVPQAATDTSVAETFNRATAKTLVMGREALTANTPIDQSLSGKTMQFGTVTTPPPASASKTLLFSSPSEPAAAVASPRHNSVEEQLLVPPTNRVMLVAVALAGALVLVGLGALVAAVLSDSPAPVVEAAPVPVVAAKPVEPALDAPAAMTPEQTQEAIARARAAVAAQEAAEAPKLVEPEVEVPKKVTRVAEPLNPSAAPAPIVATSPAAVTAPAPSPKRAPSAAPAPKRAPSADPLDSRR